MKRHYIASMVLAAASVVGVGVTLGGQDKYTLRSPTGMSFSEFDGYEQWQMVGSSQADDASGCGTSPDPGCIKSILGNPALVNAYGKGIPDNGQPVPDGAAFVKIEWTKVRDSAAPYGATVPGNLAEVAFMLKDSKRFPETDGWGYATFQYDSASDTWKAKSDVGAPCHACHTLVKGRDFVFTHYPKR